MVFDTLVNTRWSELNMIGPLHLNLQLSRNKRVKILSTSCDNLQVFDEAGRYRSFTREDVKLWGLVLVRH